MRDIRNNPIHQGQLLFTAGPAMPFSGGAAYSHTSQHIAKVVKPGIADMIRQILDASEAAWTFHYDNGASSLQEAVVRALAKPNESTVGVVANGAFGQRWADYNNELGIAVTNLNRRPGEAITAADLADFLDRAPDINVVYAVAADTSVGVQNPIEEWAAVMRAKRGDQGIFVVDDVLGLGAQEIKFDEWGLGVVVSSMAKVLGGPTHVGLCAVSEHALQRMTEIGEKVGSPTLGLMLQRRMQAEGRFHHTDGVEQTVATYDTLKGLLDGSLGIDGMSGLREHINRHNRAMEAGFTALGLFENGFQHFIRDKNRRLPQLTVLELPGELQGDPEAQFRTQLERDHGIFLGGGLGALKGKIWRIGTMGAVNLEQIQYLLEALGSVLEYPEEKVRGATEAAAEYCAGL